MITSEPKEKTFFPNSSLENPIIHYSRLLQDGQRLPGPAERFPRRRGRGRRLQDRREARLSAPLRESPLGLQVRAASKQTQVSGVGACAFGCVLSGVHVICVYTFSV